MNSRPNKYRAKRVVVDGYNFASKAEARRYGELKLMQSARKISGLLVHPKFLMRVVGVNYEVITYIADFSYRDRITGELVVEDVKGFKTAVYNLKKRLMRAVLGIEIKEIKA